MIYKCKNCGDLIEGELQLFNHTTFCLMTKTTEERTKLREQNKFKIGIDYKSGRKQLKIVYK